MRLGVDEVGVTELMGVVEHSRALATAAAALLLDSLDSERALVSPAQPSAVDEPTRALLAEIGQWCEGAMGRPVVPALWRVLAHNPHYFEATWAKERALMSDGTLAARDKRRTALGVAMAVRGRYMIEYDTAILRHAGDTDGDVLEILGVVDHYTTLNTLSEGMQIESDIRPPD
ncbi:MAG TPA: carboxymuconolactone decarboxylase family protein [Methylomirabilota bacterium]|jgi:alkylhydroperoxidase/carboxymuconolactone decarboxylase family protein YurZ|nr:carboxymuconolactone decarboxylase family protein [Methylomirabilota bacterium]